MIIPIFIFFLSFQWQVFEVVDQNEGILIPRVRLDPPHYDGVQSLAMSGGILFSGSRDSCIKKWDLSKPELIQVRNIFLK